MSKKLTAKEVSAWVHPYEVEFLYKYRKMSCKGLEEIFTKNEIYIPTPIFNDPFDCKPSLTIHRLKIKRDQYFRRIARIKHPEYKTPQINKFVRENAWIKGFTTQKEFKKKYKELISTIGVYCLSEVPDDILMWSHYSDSHKGICLQFRADEKNTFFWEALKVKYQEDYPVVNTMELQETREMFKAFLLKSNHWVYEQERRILKYARKSNQGIYKFEPDLLTGIILGVNIESDDEVKVRKWVANHSTPIKIHKAQLSKDKFKLEIPELEHKGLE